MAFEWPKQETAKMHLVERLSEVSDGSCHWPLGSTDDPAGFRFCGCRVAGRPELRAAGRAVPPYCEAHMHEAYLDDNETQAVRDALAAREAVR